MTTFLNTYHFLTEAYFALLFLFCLGITGLFILAHRAVSNEYCGVLPFSYTASSFFESISEMADNLGGLILIVIVVFSVIGWPFFLLSLAPYSLIKKLIAGNFGALTMITVIVFSLIGSLFFLSAFVQFHH